MFSTALFAMMLAAAANPTDAPRKAYTKCIEAFVKTGLEQNMSAADFEKALGPACNDPETKLRDAAIAYDVQDGVARDQAEKYISEEIMDLRANMLTLYKDYQETGSRPQ